MRPSSLHFFPLAAPFVLGLLLLAGFVIVLIEAGILGYAYAKIGVNRRYVFLLLLLSLLGSYVNIPVAQLPVFSANNIPVHVRETGWQSPVGAALLADEEAQSAR
jgi:uncharacterized membrane protein